MHAEEWTPEEEEAMRRLGTVVLTYGEAEMKDAQLVLDQLNQIAMQKKLDAENEAYLKANDKQVAGTHYKDMGVEPWDVVDTWPLEQRIGAYRHGALKSAFDYAEMMDHRADGDYSYSFWREE